MDVGLYHELGMLIINDSDNCSEFIYLTNSVFFITRCNQKVSAIFSSLRKNLYLFMNMSFVSCSSTFSKHILSSILGIRFRYVQCFFLNINNGKKIDSMFFWASLIFNDKGTNPLNKLAKVSPYCCVWPNIR